MKKLFATICFLGLVGLVVGVGVFAGDSAEISVTVSPKTISISIDTAAIDYGTMSVSETKLSSEVTPNPVLTNESGANIEVFAKSTNTENWTLSDAEIGSDQYMHQVCANCPGWNRFRTVSLFSENKELVALENMNPGEQKGLEFKFYTPSSFSNTNSQSSAITFMAVEYQPFSDVDLDGEITGNHFGYFAMSSAGDVNNDGYDDVIAGSFFYNGQTGRAYLYYGGPDMDSTPDVIFDGEGIERLGQGVYSVGDINNDGYGDVAIGAPKYNNNTGRLYIYFGGSSMDSTPDIIFEGENEMSGFGKGISLGDVNGDSYMDIILGANMHNENTGRAYVFYGGPDGPDSVFDVVFDGENVGDRFGAPTSSADINSDSYDDVIIGNALIDRVYVYFGGDSMDSTPDIVFNGETAGDYFGHSISSANVNGDGYDDVIVGAPGYNGWTGRAYVFYGGPGLNSTTPDITLDAENPGDAFGDWVSSANDVNNNGYDDVIIGADLYNGGTGRVYIYYGGDSMDLIPDITLDGEGGYFGFGVCPAGDVNADGHQDVMVDAPYHNNWKGRVYIFFGPDF